MLVIRYENHPRISTVIKRCGFLNHCYANDAQLDTDCKAKKLLQLSVHTVFGQMISVCGRNSNRFILNCDGLNVFGSARGNDSIILAVSAIQVGGWQSSQWTSPWTSHAVCLFLKRGEDIFLSQNLL